MMKTRGDSNTKESIAQIERHLSHLHKLFERTFETESKKIERTNALLHQHAVDDAIPLILTQLQSHRDHILVTKQYDQEVIAHTKSILSLAKQSSSDIKSKKMDDDQKQQLLQQIKNIQKVSQALMNEAQMIKDLADSLQQGPIIEKSIVQDKDVERELHSQLFDLFIARKANEMKRIGQRGQMLINLVKQEQSSQLPLRDVETISLLHV